MRLQAEKNRRIRLTILELLKTEYPGALDSKVLMFSLDNLGYPLGGDDLDAHLGYLEEKGLARAERKKGYGFNLLFISLTAKGWDLLDGSIMEKGVEI
jgi:hypothetical protein